LAALCIATFVERCYNKQWDESTRYKISVGGNARYHCE
jgi:hypothetical protein